MKRAQQILLILSFMQFITLLESRELVMVQVMFRHGARYSMHGNLLKNDPEMSEIVINKGQLTEVGMRQLYLLGKKIRKDYINGQVKLLDDQYNREQIHVLSSNVNRTLQSAQSFMSGVYPLGTGKAIPNPIDANLLIPPSYSDADQDLLDEKFENNTSLPQGLYPYPIHSLGDYDHILNPPCPGQDDIKQKQSDLNAKLIQTEIEKYAEEIQVITKKLNIKGNYVGHNITKIQDIVFTQKYRGVQYGLDQEQENLLKYLKAYTKSLQLFSTDYSRLITSPLFEYIFGHFDGKIEGKSTLRMVIESTHDSMIMPMMTIMNLINPNCLKTDFDNDSNTCEKWPPFASNFIFELYRINQDSYEIQIKYNGEYIKICGDKISCGYREFKTQILKKAVSKSEYYQLCQLEGLYDFNNNKKTKTPSKTSIPAWIIVLVVVLVLFIILLILYIRKLQKQHEAYYQRFRNVVQI